MLSRTEKILMVVKKASALALGLFFFLIGLSLILAKFFSISLLLNLDDLQRYIIGTVFVLYGIYRVYIGWIR